MSTGEGLNIQAGRWSDIAAAAHLPAFCRWLTPALEMADLAAGQVPEPPYTAAGWTCLPRLATRIPAANTGSVPAAREFTVATLRRWGVTGRSEDIATVMCELLTNALQHALPNSRGTPPPSPIRLGLLQPGACVLCAVADPSERLPVPKTPDSFAETGRGLHIVCALSDMWGYTTPSEHGKVVWAMFSARPVPPPRTAVWAA
jgi:Histidine kinase-like ATPase domain